MSDTYNEKINNIQEYTKNYAATFPALNCPLEGEISRVVPYRKLSVEKDHPVSFVPWESSNQDDKLRLGYICFNIEGEYESIPNSQLLDLDLFIEILENRGYSIEVDYKMTKIKIEFSCLRQESNPTQR